MALTDPPSLAQSLSKWLRTHKNALSRKCYNIIRISVTHILITRILLKSGQSLRKSCRKT
jgi:hypothetical protein